MLATRETDAAERAGTTRKQRFEARFSNKTATASITSCQRSVNAKVTAPTT
jgi:hypothetical protein